MPLTTIRKRDGKFRRGGIKREQQSESGNEAEKEDVGNWWHLRSKQISKWFEDNPLHLGISDDAVRLINEQILRGSVAGTSDTVRRKAWAHVRIEMLTVPGVPKSITLPLPSPSTTSPATIRTTASVEQGIDNKENNNSDNDLHVDPTLQKLWDRCGALEEELGKARIEHASLSLAMTRAKESAGSWQKKFEMEQALTEKMKVCLESEKTKQIDAMKDKTKGVEASATVTEGKPVGSGTQAVRALSLSRPQSAQPPATQKIDTQDTPLSSRKASNEERSNGSDISEIKNVGGKRTTSAAAGTANMSMLERQELWMQRRQAKREEEQRRREQMEAEEQKKIEEEQRKKRARSSSRWAAVRSRLRSTEMPAEKPGQVEKVPKKSKGEGTKTKRKSVTKRVLASRDKNLMRRPGLLDACEQLLAKSSKTKAAAVISHGSNTKQFNKENSLIPPADTNKVVKEESLKGDNDTGTNNENAVLEHCDDTISGDGNEETILNSECRTEEGKIETATFSTSQTEDLPLISPAFLFHRVTGDKRGQFIISDSSALDPGSMYRKRDKVTKARGVSLLVGTDTATKRERVVSVLFDPERYPQEKAKEWWDANKSRFPYRRRVKPDSGQGLPQDSVTS